MIFKRLAIVWMYFWRRLMQCLCILLPPDARIKLPFKPYVVMTLLVFHDLDEVTREVDVSFFRLQ